MTEVLKHFGKVIQLETDMRYQTCSRLHLLYLYLLLLDKKIAGDFLPTLNRVKRITRNIAIFYESQEFPPFFDRQNLTSTI